LLNTSFGPEIWDLYHRGVLQPEAVLTGRFERSLEAVDLVAVMREIDDARAEEAARKARL
jgi:RIO kinase 1